MLSQEEIDKIYEMMEDTIIFLDKLNINHMIICGTALGQARNSGFIPWDNDVDFGIHIKDANIIWDNRKQLENKGYHIIKADIGFKMGTGDINHKATINKENITIGPTNPYTGVNQDIFFLREDENATDGTPIMKYTSKRARNSWPTEVIPISGWYNPVIRKFGGYNVKILPDKELNWYLTSSYGPLWKTHDAENKEITNTKCLLHSSNK